METGLPDKKIEPEGMGIVGVSLIDGERIDSTLNMESRVDSGLGGSADVILLTDRRVIHLNMDRRHRRAVFIALEDIDGVEVASERRGGVGGYLWGGLAFLVAFAAWRAWEHPIGSAAAAAVVALMGVCLIADQILSPSTMVANFRAGPSQFQCSLNGPNAAKDIYGFINRMFQLKGTQYTGHSRRPKNFAPR